MAQWDITAPAGTGVGAGSGSNTSDVSGGRPSDFDGATINSVTLVGAGNVTLNANSSNDTIGIRWNIETSGGANTYGGVGSDAASIAYCPVTAFNILPAAIAAGGSPSPAPTTATAADWHQVAWDWTYTVAGKNDASTCDWSSFTIRVDYTPSGGPVTGSVTFTTQVDSDNTNKLTALASHSFSIDTTKTSNNTKTTTNTINFDTTLDATIINQLVSDLNIAYDLSVDQAQIISKVISAAETFGINLDTNQITDRITLESILYGLELDELLTLNKITSALQNFDLNLDYIILKQLISDLNIAYNLSMDEIEVVSTVILAAETFGLILDIDRTVIKTSSESLLYNLELDELLTLNKVTSNTVDFQTNLNYIILKQLTKDLSITLNTEVDMLQTGTTAGIINEAISFIATLDQVQSNVLTVNKALDLTLELAKQQNIQLDKLETLNLFIQASDNYNISKVLSDTVSFNIELDKIQINTLNKILLIAFNIILDDSISTSGSVFNTIVDFATVLTSNLITEGDVDANIIYGLSLSEDNTSRKLTDSLVNFDINADILTDIHLTVDGQINLSTIMEQTELRQVISQLELTFGHIYGLSSLVGAELGGDILFGTIQDISVVGTTLELILSISEDRTVKVYIEDRTSLLYEEDRIIKI
jgi:hypothetical protein